MGARSCATWHSNVDGFVIHGRRRIWLLACTWVLDVSARCCVCRTRYPHGSPQDRCMDGKALRESPWQFELSFFHALLPPPLPQSLFHVPFSHSPFPQPFFHISNRTIPARVAQRLESLAHYEKIRTVAKNMYWIGEPRLDCNHRRGRDYAATGNIH